MTPRPSVCLNVPKTGSTFTVWFLGAADWLQLKRACGARRLRLPSRAGIEALRCLKRSGFVYGNMNARVPGHHSAYSAWPAAVRGHAKLCTLREVESWYASFYLYYTRAMRHTLLARSIAFLVHGRERGCDPDLRDVLLRHKAAFLERFDARHATARSIEDIPVEFLVWFTRTVRAEYKLRRWTGIEARSTRIGYLTFRTIALLFEDPAAVFSLRPAAFEAYLATGRYRRDLRCDHFLRFDALTSDLSTLMAGELRYQHDVVAFLRERAPRRNVAPDALKPPVVRALRAGGLIDRIREDEWIYERYLLPLAGPR